MASISTTQISIEGKRVTVPALTIAGNTIVVGSGWIKVASVQGGDYTETELKDPATCVKELKQQRRSVSQADIFSFSQMIPDTAPKYDYACELDSVAVIRVDSFADWWNNRVSSYLRKDVRKAEKLGVVVRPVAFDDHLVKGIMEIYDETPIRQGRQFWHYKKGFEAVKRENSTYFDRAEFLGAFYGEELIGFLKIVYVNRIARLMQILSKDAHRDKRPMNALIVAAVRVCDAKACSYLTYGKYRYPQGSDSVTAFKHRNGFEEMLMPKYYIPLTLKGRLALQLRLHHGARSLAPDAALRALKQLRAFVYDRLELKRKSAQGS